MSGHMGEIQMYLLNFSAWEPRRLRARQISPRAANIFLCCCKTSMILRRISVVRVGYWLACTAPKSLLLAQFHPQMIFAS